MGQKEWSLLALRYGLITLGLLVWLWESQGEGRIAAGAVLFSLVLLLELPIYSTGQVKERNVWIVLQFGLGIGAFAASPGLPAGIVLSSLLCTVATMMPSIAALFSVGIASVATFLWANTSVDALATLLGLYGLALAVGWLYRMQRVERARHRATVDQLEKAHERLAAFADTSRHLAAAQERQRMTEELHDTLGHALVGALLHVQIAGRLLAREPKAAQDRLDLVEKSLRDTLEHVRVALRQGAQRRGHLPLHLALESLITDFKSAGGPEVTVSFNPDAESVSDVSPPVAQALYRTAQEALTNAVRHGQARRITVDVEAVSNRVYMRIKDDGVGAEDYAPGMGMSGMVNRIQAVGGTLRFNTAPGGGFEVEVGVIRR